MGAKQTKPKNGRHQDETGTPEISGSDGIGNPSISGSNGIATPTISGGDKTGNPRILRGDGIGAPTISGSDANKFLTLNSKLQEQKTNSKQQNGTQNDFELKPKKRRREVGTQLNL